MEQGDGVQLDAVIVVVENARDCHRVHINGPVRQHDAFRRSRAAAGVKQLRDRVLVVGQDVRALRGPGRQKILVFGIEIDGSHPRPRFAEQFDEGSEIVLIKQNSRFGMLQNRAQFGGREAHVERHHDGMGLRHAEISFEKLVRIEAEKSNPVALLDACQL